MPLFFYALKFDIDATRHLEKLPKNIQTRIMDKLKESKSNPMRFFIRLRGRIDYKLRVGEYRVIADIKHSERTIEVIKIGHRKNIYKNL